MLCKDVKNKHINALLAAQVIDHRLTGYLCHEMERTRKEAAMVYYKVVLYTRIIIEELRKYTKDLC